MIRYRRWAPVALLVTLAVGRPGDTQLAPREGPALQERPRVEGDPAAPPLPKIASLRLEPASLSLKDGRDARKVLVAGLTADGRAFDLTGAASLKAEAPIVELDAEGFVAPKAKGQTHLVVTAAGLKGRLPVTVEGADVPPVGFVRDVLPVLSRAGCNAGTCHGAQQGKNGFKLSLRGYDPDADYEALLFDVSGRRFNRVAPEESLMLLKPTAAVPHEGKQAVKPGSRAYEVLVRWIREGCRPEPGSARAHGLEILPAGNVELDLPGRSQQFAVLARYADGSIRDVTREAILTSSDTNVAEVKENRVVAVRRGEASLLVRYEGNYATKLLSVMGDRAGFAWAAPPEHNFIDAHVHAKLKLMKILPSEVCSDAEFVRRVHLDLVGMPPDGEKARAFVEDPARDKREKRIDQLIGSPAYVDFWTNKWADLLQCNSEALGQKGVWAFRDWIRQALAENKPYDRFARDLLTAQGSAYHNPATNYYRVLREPGKITEDVSQTFLGVRFNCNKCHDHPFEKWTMRQYYEFGAFFARVAIKKGTLGSETVRNFTGDNTTAVGEEIVYVRYDGGEVTHPKMNMPVPPKVPFGEAPSLAEDGDRRDAFVRWMTSKENPLFAKALVNRVWSYFTGRGIIDPVDDIRASNPPSNPGLLAALADDFVKHGYDLRRLHRTICRSRTYQLSIKTNRWNEDDRVNFSHAFARRLSAEQLQDAIAVATGVRMRFSGLPEGMRAVEIPDGMVVGGGGMEFLKLFGRPERKSACECERKTDSFTLSHTMNLVNGPVISDAVHSPKARFVQMVAAEKDDAKLVEAIYYAVLDRAPTAKEREVIDLKSAPSRLEAAQDLAWALMNTPAFIFNR